MGGGGPEIDKTMLDEAIDKIMNIYGDILIKLGKD